MKKNIHIFKIGGGVLHSPENFKQFLKSIPYMGVPDASIMRICIISAFGTITQRIQAMIDTLTECDGVQGELVAENSIKEIKKIVLHVVGTTDVKKLYHTNIQLNLLRVSVFTALRNKHSGVALTDAQQAEVLQYGELISSCAVFNILGSVLKKTTVEYIESNEVIKTNDNYLSAVVDMEKTREKLEAQFSRIEFTQPDAKDLLVVMPGFISSFGERGIPTLLGLEGSDYTAAIVTNLAHEKMGFEQVTLTFLKGSPGISLNYQGAGSTFEDTVTWDQVEEKVSHGDKILHPKVIGLLKGTTIPVSVTNLDFFSGRHTHRTKIIS